MTYADTHTYIYASHFAEYGVDDTRQSAIFTHCSLRVPLLTMSDQFLSLLKQELWQISTNHDEVPVSERIRLSYLRARSLALHLGMTVDDITQLSRKFWDFHLSSADST